MSGVQDIDFPLETTFTEYLQVGKYYNLNGSLLLRTSSIAMVVVLRCLASGRNPTFRIAFHNGNWRLSILYVLLSAYYFVQFLRGGNGDSKDACS